MKLPLPNPKTKHVLSTSTEHYSRAVILLGTLVVILAAGYLSYTLYFKDQLESTNQTTSIALKPVITKLPLEAVINTQVQKLEHKKYTEYANQDSATSQYYPEPAPPAKVVVADTTLGNSAFISWTVLSEQSHDGVEIFRSSTKQFPKEPIAIIEQMSGTYIDAEVEDGKQYYYQVRAFRKIENEIYYSLFTETMTLQASDTTPPLPPFNIQVTVQEDDPSRLMITWENDDNDVALNRVYRSAVYGEIGKVIEEVQKDITQLIDPTVEPGITYYYTVSAVDAAGNESSLRLPVAPIGNKTPFLETTPQ